MRKRTKITKNKEAVEEKIAEVKELSPVEMLVDFGLKEEEAERLLGIKNKKGENLVNVNKKDEIFELLMRIRNFGFDDIYSELTSKEYAALSQYYFEKMTEQQKIYVTKTLQKNVQNKSVKGLFECARCKREGRPSRNTTSITRYYRGDEPGLSQVTCSECGYKWKTN